MLVEKYFLFKNILLLKILYFVSVLVWRGLNKNFFWWNDFSCAKLQILNSKFFNIIKTFSETNSAIICIFFLFHLKMFCF